MYVDLKLLINAFSGLLCVLLGLASALVFWQSYGYWVASNKAFSSGAFSATAVASRSQKTLSKTPDYVDEIGILHLFGKPLATNNINQVVEQDMPESRLRVTIKGILSLPDQDRSIAIISVENAKDKVFKVGSELTKNYKIHQIVADGIVLDHKGSLEMIRLPRETMAEITTKNTATRKNTSMGLGELRAKVMRNPLALEQYITFVPYINSGQFSGYRVNQGKHSELFQKLGLHANDIVSSVDGVSIDQVAGRMDILTNLSVVKSLSLGIIRDGIEQQIFVDFSQ